MSLSFKILTNNVALRKETFVRVYTEHVGGSKAVDGIMNTDSRKHSCAIVNTVRGDPWWQVDLVAPHIVRSVTLTAASDIWGKT